MFTQQHFKKIAETLRAERPGLKDYELPESQWGVLVVKFADVLGYDNPRFDRERFIRRCGMPEGK